MELGKIIHGVVETCPVRQLLQGRKGKRTRPAYADDRGLQITGEIQHFLPCATPKQTVVYP